MPASNATHTDLAYADMPWKSADALRGQVDAVEYKHVVLGLLFLKYISDSFEARREGLKAELEADSITGKQLESLLENRDEYTAERVFWVPLKARWSNLQNQATRPDIATLIDGAILAVERDNPNFKGKLPRDYARRGIAPEKMKGLIGLIADIGFKGGRAYDLYCGSVGMFVQPERFVEAYCEQKTGILIFDQESSPTTWRLAKMKRPIQRCDLSSTSKQAQSPFHSAYPTSIGRIRP